MRKAHNLQVEGSILNTKHCSLLYPAPACWIFGPAPSWYPGGMDSLFHFAKWALSSAVSISPQSGFLVHPLVHSRLQRTKPRLCAMHFWSVSDGLSAVFLFYFSLYWTRQDPEKVLLLFTPLLGWGNRPAAGSFPKHLLKPFSFNSSACASTEQ